MVLTKNTSQRKLEFLLAYHKHLVVEKGLPPSKMLKKDLTPLSLRPRGRVTSTNLWTLLLQLRKGKKFPLPMLILRNMALGNLKEWHAFLKRQKDPLFVRTRLHPSRVINLSGKFKAPQKDYYPPKMFIEKKILRPPEEEKCDLITLFKTLFLFDQMLH